MEIDKLICWTSASAFSVETAPVTHVSLMRLKRSGAMINPTWDFKHWSFLPRHEIALLVKVQVFWGQECTNTYRGHIMALDPKLYYQIFKFFFCNCSPFLRNTYEWMKKWRSYPAHMTESIITLIFSCKTTNTQRSRDIAAQWQSNSFDCDWPLKLHIFAPAAGTSVFLVTV